MTTLMDHAIKSCTRRIITNLVLSVRISLGSTVARGLHPAHSDFSPPPMRLHFKSKQTTSMNSTPFLLKFRSEIRNISTEKLNEMLSNVHIAVVNGYRIKCWRVSIVTPKAIDGQNVEFNIRLMFGVINWLPVLSIVQNQWWVPFAAIILN